MFANTNVPASKIITDELGGAGNAENANQLNAILVAPTSQSTHQTQIMATIITSTACENVVGVEIGERVMMDKTALSKNEIRLTAVLGTVLTAVKEKFAQEANVQHNAQVRPRAKHVVKQVTRTPLLSKSAKEDVHKGGSNNLIF